MPQPSSVGDLVAVWTTPAGAPQRLEWGGCKFVVSAKPVAWIDRVPWWQLSTRAPNGSTGALLERLTWRVQAMSIDDGQTLTLDLVPSPQNDWWQVVQVSD
ncbi:MAG: hypothetical protein LBN10_00570 [Propionibacteriaceae bacterium]|jgi:hypothetical protein|nr:hypothetical protein [Propionibacteriaceae bacterium]